MRITTGTASVLAGGTVVTGSGTSWLSAGITPGMASFAIGLPHVQARVARVASDTVLHLAGPWPGITYNGAAYTISVDFTHFLGMPTIDETAAELPTLWNAAMPLIEARLLAMGEPVTAPLPRIDETTPNVADLWNAMLNEVEVRLTDLGITP